MDLKKIKERINRPSKWKRVLRYVILALLGIIIGVNVYWLNAAKLTGNQVPMPFGYGASVVLTGSMEPTISQGDLILIRAEEGYEVDDIVVYQSGNISVVHRVVSIDEETVVTKGDANNSSDEPFPVEAIKGEVFAAVPKVGYAVWMLKSPAGIIVTVTAAVLLVELSYLNERKRKTEEQEKIKEEIRRLAEELKKE